MRSASGQPPDARRDCARRRASWPTRWPRARERHHAPRLQARERHARSSRPPEGARLRPGATSAESGVLTRRGAMATHARRAGRHAGLHGAEQLNGQRADARADVFAYGVVMYEYACGAHPFDASTPLASRRARARKRRAADRRSRAAHPGAVSRWSSIGACASRPADRFASAARHRRRRCRRGDAARRGAVAPAAHRPGGACIRSVVMAVYVVAAALAWSIKEAFRRLAAAVAVRRPRHRRASVARHCLRGHLLFTSAINRPRLQNERRARPARVDERWIC